jgi:hypothetical protein
VDVVTPIWSGPARREGRVVGLLSVGLDVKQHLKGLIDMPDDLLDDNQGIARALTAYVVNDHGAWTWHEVGMQRLEEDAAAGRQLRDPEHLTTAARALAAKHGGSPDDYVPWESADRGMTSGADRYIDPVELAAGKGPRWLIAHTLTFHPYQYSAYDGLKGREWGFVVQVPEDVAFRPVERLKTELAWAGSVLVAALAALTVGLWVWLFRLLRGWEFAGQG